MTRYCTYIHSRPNGLPFYVGKGTVGRAYSLRPQLRNKIHAKVVAKYGAENIIINVIECSTEANALDLEIGLIKHFRYKNIRLVNITSGGEGLLGVKQPKEWVEKRISKVRGVPKTAEFKHMMSVKMTGKKCSEATKSKLSAINKSKAVSDAFKAKWGTLKGDLNGMARAVVCCHPELGELNFSTMTEAATYIQGSVAKISRAIKSGYKHKGCTFKYANSK